MNAIIQSEDQAGREAAERLCQSWPDLSWSPTEPTVAWARGAVEGFADIVRRQDAIFRASQAGAENSARTLSPRPFQGLTETLQNADDLGATELRIAFRSQPRRELLLVHNGRPVVLKDMGAMVLPWLSAKGDDDEASGRFGIGQKTLQALGGPIAMHCSPFHFEMQAEGPISVDPQPAVGGVYVPSDRETLVLVPLEADYAADQVRDAVGELGVDSLLFLKSVRRLAFVNLDTPEASTAYELNVGVPRSLSLPFFDTALEAEATDLEVVAPAVNAGRCYRRYWARRSTPNNQTRANKATGKVTPLGLSIARAGDASGHLYDRVQMPVDLRFPISLNAQFDPDAARTTVLPLDWNRYRFEDLGEFLASAALAEFNRCPAEAWSHIPLSAEVEAAQGWLGDRLRTDVAQACHRRLLDALSLPDLDGSPRPIADFVYEAAELDGLLSPEDQAALSDAAVIGRDHRDAGGRWRDVLNELGVSRCLGLDDALEVFDLDEATADREPDWFVSMAALAGRRSRFDAFLAKRSILLADGRVVQAPQRGSSRVLVREALTASLAFRLELAWALHPAYLAETAEAQEALTFLTNAGVLVDGSDRPADALDLLGRAPAERAVRIGDKELLALRDAWAHVARDRQRFIGERVGLNIEIRVLRHVDGKPQPGWARPADAYMPGTIDKEVDSFPKVAAGAEGLLWADPDYAKVLKHAGGRSEAGAQRFLGALGVARAPRLVPPPNERTGWSRDSRRASAVGAENPDAQRQAVRGVSATHLIGDRWSPDLDLVIADICHSPAKMRRKRALGLLSLLARMWERRYADYETAEAVNGYGGYWHRRGDIQSTWLAKLASVAWLPNGANGFDEPGKLCLPTPANKLAHGTNRRAFLAQVPRHVETSGLLTALGVQSGPSAGELLSRLEAHRGKPITPALREQVHTIYHLLAQSLKDPSADATVGRAITPLQLRNTFRATASAHGLVLTQDGWHSPEAVFRGPAIFGHRRPFAPQIAGLESLWSTLNVPLPTAVDCTAVLRELAGGPLTPVDKGVMLSTLRAMAHLIDRVSPQLRTSLQLLPLWSGQNWSRSRPAYVFEGDGLADATIASATVWRPGLTTLAEIEPLLGILGVIPLRLEHFAPVNLTAAGAAEGARSRSRFAAAVGLLGDELIRGDVNLYNSLSISWDALMRAEVVLEPSLEIEADLGQDRTVKIAARAHLAPEPTTFVARSLDDFGDSQGGGQAIASLFKGDRQKVAWAWSAVWARAAAEEGFGSVVLPQLKADAASSTSRLTQLQQQTENRTKAKDAGKAGTGSGGGKPPSRPAPKIEVRQLKDLSEYEPTEGVIVNPGGSTTGVVFPKPSSSNTPRTFEAYEPAGIDNRATKPRSVLPPASDRESLALDAVRRALRLDPEQIRDVRDRRGFGADAIDELRQLYELKMCSGSTFPSEVRLETSQVQAALDEPDFFLVLVAGLEDGEGALRVRFIFNPLQTLAAKIHGELTLAGVDKVEALEYAFTREQGVASSEEPV